MLSLPDPRVVHAPASVCGGAPRRRIAAKGAIKRAQKLLMHKLGILQGRGEAFSGSARGVSTRPSSIASPLGLRPALFGLTVGSDAVEAQVGDLVA